MAKQNIYARVSPEIVAKLQAFAQLEQCTFSEIITRALGAYLFSSKTDKTPPVVPPLPASTMYEILTHQLAHTDLPGNIFTDDDVINW